MADRSETRPERTGSIVCRANLLGVLRQREVARVAGQLSNELEGSAMSKLAPAIALKASIAAPSS